MLRNVEGYLQNITVPIHVITTITDFKDFIILSFLKILKIYDSSRFFMTMETVGCYHSGWATAY